MGEFLEDLLAGDAAKVVSTTREELEKGTSPERVIMEGLIPAMNVVGDKFRDGEIFIPEVMLAAKAMKAAMEVLKPLLSQSSGIKAGKVIIGTVKGDLHDIGKNLVVMMMEGGGFEVVDLGTDVSPERFVESVRAHNPVFVGMSALLTTTMPQMRQTIQALEGANLRPRVRVIVGGAPVTEGFARSIGADGYAPDATSVVPLLKSLL